MRILFQDFETYYDKEYSLRKMTAAEYILNPRFKVHGCAFKWRGEEAFWIDDTQIYFFIGDLPKDIMVVSHNALFDMAINAWRFGYRPQMYGDTLAVARATINAYLKRLSLDSVSQYLGFGKKDTDALASAVGLQTWELKERGLYERLARYSLGDVEKCANIFEELVINRKFPTQELLFADMVIRCCTDPKFILNKNILQQYYDNILKKKEEILASIGLTTDDQTILRSNDQFANVLRNLGVEPPTKVSPTTNKTTYAFAKTDTEFIDLLEHENETVQLVVAARLGTKTSIAETRATKFLNIANLRWPNDINFYQSTLDGVHGLMPMPLHYGAAHTHRLGGTWALNVQNMPRKWGLRTALEAPPGYVIVSVDGSQIEARFNCWFCDQLNLLEQFNNNEDVYSIFATDVFGYTVTKATHFDERFVGKQGILGLGYGLGHLNFRKRIKTDSLTQIGRIIELSPEKSMQTVNTYRNKHYNIKNTWGLLNNIAIPALANGNNMDLKCLKIRKNSILLPSNLELFYHNLRYDTETKNWIFEYGGSVLKIYGGKLLENIIQALARIAVSDAAIRIFKRTKQYFALQAHDELVYIIPEYWAESFMPIIKEEMERRPIWAPGVPLAAEVGIGRNYEEAK